MSLLCGLFGSLLGLFVGVAALLTIVPLDPEDPLPDRVLAWIVLVLLAVAAAVIRDRSESPRAFFVGMSLTLASLAILFTFLVHAPPLPIDQAMRENFARHEADLERIRQMLQDDPNLSQVDGGLLARDEPLPEGVSLAPKRVAAFRRLLRAAGVKKARRDSSGATLYFECWTNDFDPGSPFQNRFENAKGYVYSKSPLVDEGTSQDDDSLGSTKTGMSFENDRHLRGNWYLYFRHSLCFHD